MFDPEGQPVRRELRHGPACRVSLHADRRKRVLTLVSRSRHHRLKQRQIELERVRNDVEETQN